MVVPDVSVTWFPLAKTGPKFSVPAGEAKKVLLLVNVATGEPLAARFWPPKVNAPLFVMAVLARAGRMLVGRGGGEGTAPVLMNGPGRGRGPPLPGEWPCRGGG